MLHFLLHPVAFPVFLAAVAVLCPLACVVIARRRAAARGRLLVACGLLGPMALVLWGFHQGVLALVGFDAALSALIILVTGLAAGLILGEWVRRKPFAER
ncbi:MAG: hypothetical protein PWP23_2472 [Candidatus Sumerlaeota bacterium]|nr:hypothetical protein [Candidatus Sumerlaeota bacterium]